MPTIGLLRVLAAHRAVERGVEGEDTAVGGHLVVAARVGNHRHAHHRLVEGLAPHRAEERGVEGEQAAVGGHQLVPAQVGEGVDEPSHRRDGGVVPGQGATAGRTGNRVPEESFGAELHHVGNRSIRGQDGRGSGPHAVGQGVDDSGRRAGNLTDPRTRARPRPRAGHAEEDRLGRRVEGPRPAGGGPPAGGEGLDEGSQTAGRLGRIGAHRHAVRGGRARHPDQGVGRIGGGPTGSDVRRQGRGGGGHRPVVDGFDDRVELGGSGAVQPDRGARAGGRTRDVFQLGIADRRGAGRHRCHSGAPRPPGHGQDQSIGNRGVAVVRAHRGAGSGGPTRCRDDLGRGVAAGIARQRRLGGTPGTTGQAQEHSLALTAAVEVAAGGDAGAGRGTGRRQQLGARAGVGTRRGSGAVTAAHEPPASVSRRP